jgi:ABC-2 type transport system permease protein
MTSVAAERTSSFRFRSPSAHVLGALVRRDFLIARSYRLAFAFDLLVTLFNLVGIYFVSRTFQGAGTVRLDGAPSYFGFAAVGMTLSVVVVATSGALAQQIRDEQLTGTLEALVAQPVTATDLSIGLAGFPVLFATVRTAGYLLVAGPLLGLDLSHANWFGFIVVLAAAAAAFAGIGIVAGAVVLVIKRGGAVIGALAFAMTMLGGSIFPVHVLPGWLRWASVIAPPRYAFDGVRAALFGTDGWAGDAFVLVVFSAVALPIAVILFSRALARARKSGTLGQY